MIQKNIEFESLHLHRTRDPDTSRAAAFDVVATGTAARMERLALRYITENLGRTARELEVIAGVENGQIRKRLATLRRKGKIVNGKSRRCQISGRNAQTWFAVEQPVA